MAYICPNCNESNSPKRKDTYWYCVSCGIVLADKKFFEEKKNKPKDVSKLEKEPENTNGDTTEKANEDKKPKKTTKKTTKKKKDEEKSDVVVNETDNTEKE